MYKRTRITQPSSQEITEMWPGVWEFNGRVYNSLAVARSVRADINKAHGIYNREDAIYNYEEANIDD